MNFPPFKMILVLTNFSLLSFLIMLMIDHYNSHNNVESWSSAFHVLTLLWLSIRGAFWFCTVISTTPWSSWSFYALYWMANPIEFGSFMLLPLFFSQVLYPSEWKKYWGYIRIIYIGVIGSLIVFQAVWAFHAAIEQKKGVLCDPSDPTKDADSGNDCFHTEFSSNAFRAITAFCFVFLAATQAAYGLKLAYLDKKLHDRYLISSPSILAGVNVVLVISFMSRGLYQFGTIFRVFLLADIPLQGDDDVSFAILFAFIVWDYIPTTLLVITITSKALGSKSGRVKNKIQSTTWHTYKETSVINSSTVSFPGYGLFRQLAEEECSSVASSYRSQASSAEIRGGLHGSEMWYNNELPQADPSFLTLKRFEQPTSLRPPTSWLNNSFLQVSGRHTSLHSSVTSHPESSSSLDAIPQGMLSKSINKNTISYGSYRSYSQGSEKDKEREIAILMYYENDRRRRADLAASSDVSTEAHEHTSPSVQMRAPSSSSAGGKGGGGSSSGRSGSREEEKARSPAMRGGGGGDDVWPNRSVNFGVGDGKDASQKDMFLSASAEAECRKLQSITPSMNATGGVGAKGVQGEARDYDIYDVNRTINRGSFRSSSSYTAGEMLRRGNDQIYDVIETSAAKSRGGAAAGMKEETNKLGVGVGSGSAGGSGNSGSFREEKALVQGFPDMSNRGLHPHSPSFGRARSKEGMGVGVNIGMGMGLGMGGHQAVVPSMPIEQKACASSAESGPGFLKGPSDPPLAPSDTRNFNNTTSQAKQVHAFEEVGGRIGDSRRRTATETSPTMQRNYVARSSSASRAQQRPLLRRVGTHALPMVNTPSPPDFESLTRQVIAAAAAAVNVGVPVGSGGGGGVQNSEGNASSATDRRRQQLQLQQEQSTNVLQRKGVTPITKQHQSVVGQKGNTSTNIYSPGEDYSIPKTKSSNFSAGKYQSGLDPGLLHIPEYRPRGDKSQTLNISDKSNANQNQNRSQGVTDKTLPQQQQQSMWQWQSKEQQNTTLQPRQQEHQQQQQYSRNSQVQVPTPSPALFGSMNPFKNFNPFGGPQAPPPSGTHGQAVSKSNIPLTATNSPKTPKSPKIELIHSRPTRPMMNSDVFASPSTSFRLAPFGSGSGSGGGMGSSSRSSNALSRTVTNNALEADTQPRTGSCGAVTVSGTLRSPALPRGRERGVGVGGHGSGSSSRSPSGLFEDDVAFMSRDVIARPPTVPYNPISPSSSSLSPAPSLNDSIRR